MDRQGRYYSMTEKRWEKFDEFMNVVRAFVRTKKTISLDVTIEDGEIKSMGEHVKRKLGKDDEEKN